MALATAPYTDEQREKDRLLVAAHLARLAPQGYGKAPAYIRPSTWINAHHYIPETQQPIKLLPHQCSIVDFALDPNNDFRTFIYSTTKKSGKTAVAGAVGRYLAENSGYRSEVYFVGHDLEQGRGRSYKSVIASIELTPGYDKGKHVLPGKWKIIERHAIHLPTQSEIRALSNDAQGEAGGNPTVSIWTELWAHKSEASHRLWSELTPVLTRERSMRIVETYAGYEDESDLLLDLYKLGLQGNQLTHDEINWPFPDRPPIWVNKEARLFMYWDSGEVARRMPWQGGMGATPQQIEEAEKYYAEQKQSLRDEDYKRFHLNEWTSSVNEFISEAQWLKCKDTSVPTLRTVAEGDKTPVILGLDASVSNDCTALVLVSRHPTRKMEVAVRKTRVYYPYEFGGIIDLQAVEDQVREWCKLYNVVQIAYDAFQLHQMAGRLRVDAVSWINPFGQMNPRAMADKQLYDLIMNMKISHDGDPNLLTHVKNSATKATALENEKMRLVKKAKDRPIDLTVAMSMAAYECLRLSL